MSFILRSHFPAGAPVRSPYKGFIVAQPKRAYGFVVPQGDHACKPACPLVAVAHVHIGQIDLGFSASSSRRPRSAIGRTSPSQIPRANLVAGLEGGVSFGNERIDSLTFPWCAAAKKTARSDNFRSRIAKADASSCLNPFLLYPPNCSAVLAHKELLPSGGAAVRYRLLENIMRFARIMPPGCQHPAAPDALPEPGSR